MRISQYADVRKTSLLKKGAKVFSCPVLGNLEEIQCKVLYQRGLLLIRGCLDILYEKELLTYYFAADSIPISLFF
jgi:hypothetical protein